MDGSEWRWHLLLRERRSIAAEVESLKELLSGHGIGSNLDEPSWCLGRDGMFTVNSLYKRITIRGVSCSFSGNIWKNILPTKVKIFFWLLIKDRLQTKGNLVLKGWMGDPRCVYCNKFVETTEHLFFQCEETSRIWLDLSSLGSMQIGSIPGADLQSLLFLFKTAKTNDLQHILIPTICWILWRERNNTIFRDTKLDIKEVLIRCCNFLSFWISNSTGKRLEETGQLVAALKSSIL